VAEIVEGLRHVAFAGTEIGVGQRVGGHAVGRRPASRTGAGDKEIFHRPDDEKGTRRMCGAVCGLRHSSAHVDHLMPEPRNRPRLGRLLLIWGVGLPLGYALSRLFPGFMRELQPPQLPFHIPLHLAILAVALVGIRIYIWLTPGREEDD
jgi:hypothetical protein